MWPLERLRRAHARGRGQVVRGYGAWSRRRLREGCWREARFPFVQIRHFARQRQWRRRRRLEPLIGFRGPVLEPISAGSEPGERGTVSMRSQYPAAQSRPQRPDWRVSLTTQERPRRPSSPGVEPRLPELSSQRPRLGVRGGLRGPSSFGMAPWSQAFRDLDPLRVLVADAPLVPDPRVPGGQVADRPATGRGGFPHVVPASSYGLFLCPRVPGPDEAHVPLSSAQLGLQIRSEARRRRAARPPRPTPGPLARPSSRPATGAPGRRRYHPFLARHFLPAQSAVSAHLGAGAQPSALPLFAPCLGVRNLDVAELITLCILNDWGHTSRSSYYPSCLLP